MSEALLVALRADTNVKVANLPDAQEWANRFFGKEIVLRPDEPFLDQVFALAPDNFEATHWDPYEEGYDDGPGDVRDHWRTGGRTSTGQFSGWDVEEHAAVFDPISASIACALVDMFWDEDVETQEQVRETFTEALEDDWRGPRPQAERDKALSVEILRLASKLSPAAVKDVVEQLGDW